jgi:carbon-monoxide dehydrogenase medium subunit/6-hydroxypseudooxynicotine dehydrogenase subunit alpha
MKPPIFDYHAPRELDEALALLAERGDDAAILAGGQSLMPLLNFRLARPVDLIDINRIPALAGMRVENGTLIIGAMTRTETLERSSIVREGWPLLRAVAPYIGHAAIRNRGTIGGSCAHADPMAELPVAFRALDAIFHLQSQAGTRTLSAADFFLGTMTTAKEPDELLVAIEVPALAPNTTHGFSELSRTSGAFALAGAAVTVTRDEAGACTAAAIALLGGDDMPLRAAAAEAALIGIRPTAQQIDEIAQLATSDTHPPEAERYRRALLAEMTRCALAEAFAG